MRETEEVGSKSELPKSSEYGNLKSSIDIEGTFDTCEVTHFGTLYDFISLETVENYIGQFQLSLQILKALHDKGNHSLSEMIKAIEAKLFIYTQKPSKEFEIFN
jgi:hypothetical protein